MKTEQNSLLRQIDGGALDQLISASHLSWRFDADLADRLEGSVLARSLGPLRLAWVRVNESAGQRAEEDLRASPEPYLNLIMPLQGAIVLQAERHTVEIGTNQLAFWDSTQLMSFKVDHDGLEQLSILIPQRLLRATPEACAQQHCSRLDGDHLLTDLCAHHVATLAKYLEDEHLPYEFSIGAVTVNLVDAVIASRLEQPKRRSGLLFEIQEYIECYITEETLSAQTISEAFNVSVRHVHKLFEKEDTTVRNWIVRRRLERSAGDLRGGSEQITEIAFKWGFKDLGHYSRAFRRQFGVTPSAYRKGE